MLGVLLINIQLEEQGERRCFRHKVSGLRNRKQTIWYIFINVYRLLKKNPRKTQKGKIGKTTLQVGYKKSTGTGDKDGPLISDYGLRIA